jgi:phage-related protein
LAGGVAFWWALFQGLEKNSQMAIIKIMNIDFYRTSSGRNVIDEFVRGLPPQDQGRFVDVYKGILAEGLRFSRVQFRQLAGKLWEVKYSAPGGKYRIAYVMLVADRMVWLHMFKKTTKKTPKNDLELALKRMGEVLKS